MIRELNTAGQPFFMRREGDRFVLPAPKPIMVCPVLSTLYLARKYAHEEESYWMDMMDIQSEVYEDTTMGVVDGHSRWMVFNSLGVQNMLVEFMRPGVSQSEMVISHSYVAITKPYTIELSS
jgi:hypothetical protein